MTQTSSRTDQSLARRLPVAASAKCRPGYSLTELVVVLALMSAVGTLTGLMMHRILRLDQGLRQDIVRWRAFEELEVAYRTDVRQADHLELSDDRQELLIRLPDGRQVFYRTGHQEIARIEDQLNAAAPRRRISRFQLPHCRAVLSLQHRPNAHHLAKKTAGDMLCILRVEALSPINPTVESSVLPTVLEIQATMSGGANTFQLLTPTVSVYDMPLHPHDSRQSHLPRLVLQAAPASPRGLMITL